MNTSIGAKKARQEFQLPEQTTITDKANNKNENQLKQSHGVSDINICWKLRNKLAR